MRWTITLILFVLTNASNAQHFIKSYEILPLHNERGNSLIIDESNFFVQLGAVCQSTSRDCSMIAKLDHQGELIDTTILNYIDAGASTFVKEEDQFYLGGHVPDLTEKRPLIHNFTLDLDSIALTALTVQEEFSFFLV